jgi:hypothetical protein
MSQEDLDFLHGSLKQMAKQPKRAQIEKLPVHERQGKQKNKSIEILNQCIFSNLLPHIGFVYERGNYVSFHYLFYRIFSEFCFYNFNFFA